MPKRLSSTLSYVYIVLCAYETIEGETQLGQRGRAMLPVIEYYLIPVHTGDKVEFDTVDFVESRQSRLCGGRVHTGHKVDRIGDKVDRVGENVDRDKLSNSSCCRFVARTGDKVDCIGDSRLCCRFVAGFGNSRLCRQCVPGFKSLIKSLDVTQCYSK